MRFKFGRGGEWDNGRWARSRDTAPVAGEVEQRRNHHLHCNIINHNPITSGNPPYTLSSASLRLTLAGSKNGFSPKLTALLPFLSPKPDFLPTTTAQISAAVLCASSLNIPVQAKSGGHSYASFSSGGDALAQTLVIDLERLQDIVVDNKTWVASVGGGVRLGNLALGIYAQGQRALAHGTCPGVGIGGHFTHGGYGYSSRAYGLALEQIVGVEVVLASGEVVRASEEENEDVYWVCSFLPCCFLLGVGLMLTCERNRQSAAPPTRLASSRRSICKPSRHRPSSSSHMTSRMSWILRPWHVTSALLVVQSFALNSSVVTRELGLGVTITASSFAVHGTYFGSMRKFNSAVAPALLGALKKSGVKVSMEDSSSSVEQLSWIESLTELGGAPTLAVPLTGYDSRDNFFAKSVSVSEPFGEKPVKAYFDVVVKEGKRAPVDWFAIINLMADRTARLA